MSKAEEFDVCIIGLGSGGIGAMLTCIDHGLNVVAIEKESGPGGNSVFNGVPSYPAGPAERYNKMIYDKVNETDQHSIGFAVPSAKSKNKPSMYSAGGRQENWFNYNQSLFRRFPGSGNADLKTISPTILFDPLIFKDVVNDLFNQNRQWEKKKDQSWKIYGKVVDDEHVEKTINFDEYNILGGVLSKSKNAKVYYNSTFDAIQKVSRTNDQKDYQISEIACTDHSKGHSMNIQAKVFIDCSANLLLGQRLRNYKDHNTDLTEPGMFMHVDGEEREYAELIGKCVRPELNGTSQVYSVKYQEAMNRQLLTPRMTNKGLLSPYITGWSKRYYNITPLKLAIDGADFYESNVQKNRDEYEVKCKIMAIYHWVMESSQYHEAWDKYALFGEEEFLGSEDVSPEFKKFWGMFKSGTPGKESTVADVNSKLGEIITKFSKNYEFGTSKDDPAEVKYGVRLKNSNDLMATFSMGITGIYKNPGVREYFRLKSKYIFTSDDQKVGMNFRNSEKAKKLNLHFIGRVEQPSDYHSGEVTVNKDSEDENVKSDTPIRKSYLVPYETLITDSYTNYIVACRGAGFDHVAASSARLSKNMMGFGHAAGYAAALSIAAAMKSGGEVDIREAAKIEQIDIKDMKEEIGEIELDYTLEEHMRIAFGANSWTNKKKS